MAAKIRKGDSVIVLTGKDKGKTGTVLTVFPDENKLIVQGVSIKKKHQKQTQTQQAGIIEKKVKYTSQMLLFLSRVNLKNQKLVSNF